MTAPYRDISCFIKNALEASSLWPIEGVRAVAAPPEWGAPIEVTALSRMSEGEKYTVTRVRFASGDEVAFFREAVPQQKWVNPGIPACISSHIWPQIRQMAVPTTTVTTEQCVGQLSDYQLMYEFGVIFVGVRP